ncbi:MAG: hypothetical protein IIB38_11465, partial [Candidatus Hydrogenedentes bacterium]|nr:hypothetical protein [Candidatus Hydrogenedentota bacterium]
GRANRLAVTVMQLGLNVKVDDHLVVPGQDITITATLTDYGVRDADLVMFSLEAGDWVRVDLVEPVNREVSEKGDASVTYTPYIPQDLRPTIPHEEMLFEPHFLEPQYTVVARVKSASGTLELRKPILLDVAPPVSVAFVEAPYLIRRGIDDTAAMNILLTNHTPGAKSVTLELSVPKGLSASQKKFTVDFASAGGQKIVPITLKLAKNLEARDYVLSATIVGSDASAEGIARVVDLEIPHDIRVGVIQSYDTTFINTLARFNVPHEALTIEDFTPERLDAFSTIIVDIRAYLVRPDLVANNQALLDYVKRGGTAIVMYHKTFEWKKEFAPYPLSLGRNRVTVEDAPITVLEPKHALFNTPNVIVATDWDGWKQERGLYFPSRWDDRYTPLIDCNDPGESPPPGSCLITRYGDGTYLYTALGWYRQLRELHPGTLRIFANMLAL